MSRLTNVHHWTRSLMPAAAVLLLGAISVNAQEGTGDLSGLVGTPSIRLAGATVTLSGDAIAEDRTTTTSDGGVYSFEGLPPGEYTVTVEKDGYQVAEKTAVVTANQISVRLFLLPNDLTGVTGPRLTAIVSAADLPGYSTPQSNGTGAPYEKYFDILTPGMLAVFYGVNLTPGDGLQQPGVLPLPTDYAGVSLVFIQNGETYPAPIHYLSPTQGAIVVPSGLQLGEATARLTVNGVTTEFTTYIGVSNPAFFTWSQNGQGQVVASHLTYAPVTLNDPAKPGETIILWGTGFGRSETDDNIPQALDKLGAFQQFTITVGGVEMHIDYFGSGGFPGGDMLIGTLSEDTPNSCANPVRGEGQLKEPENDDQSMAPMDVGTKNTYLAVSSEGNCGMDGPLFNATAEEISQMFDAIGHTDRAHFRIGAVDSLADGALSELYTLSFDAVRITPSTLQPHVTPNTCLDSWLPKDMQPVAPMQLPRTGQASVQFSNFSLPNEGLYSRAGTQFAVGAVSGMFPQEIDGSMNLPDAEWTYDGAIEQAAAEFLAQLDGSEILDWELLLGALLNGNYDEDVQVELGFDWDQGDYGHHFLDCSIDPTMLTPEEFITILENWKPSRGGSIFERRTSFVNFQQRHDSPGPSPFHRTVVDFGRIIQTTRGTYLK